MQVMIIMETLCDGIHFNALMAYGTSEILRTPTEQYSLQQQFMVD